MKTILMCSRCGHHADPERAEAAEDTLGVAVCVNCGGELWGIAEQAGVSSRLSEVMFLADFN